MIFINHTKCCSKCKEEKSISEFSKAKNGKYGVSARCKICDKLYRLENAEKIKHIRSLYYDENKEHILQKVKEYSIDNKKLRSQYLKKYISINNQKIKVYKKEYEKERKSKDKLYILKHNIRSMINRSLQGYNKNSTSEKILHCSFEFFVNYIENKFQEGMSWDNRNEWHIDHIIPISFGASLDELIVLNHYSNLQPLWKNENLSKRDKLVPNMCSHVLYVVENIPRLKEIINNNDEMD